MNDRVVVMRKEDDVLYVVDEEREVLYRLKKYEDSSCKILILSEVKDIEGRENGR